ncbi:hypothetical protein [Myxococcus sp. Y35]|uniref:hypothetical protein n=1 Tax=Pseudomyxococcus flavus TaxID=3115648 RepID=UPI003CF6E567
MNEDGKLTDEARRAIFGKSERESEASPPEEDRNRQYSGASESGSPDSQGSDKQS